MSWNHCLHPVMISVPRPLPKRLHRLHPPPPPRVWRVPPMETTGTLAWSAPKKHNEQSSTGRTRFNFTPKGGSLVERMEETVELSWFQHNRVRPQNIFFKGPLHCGPDCCKKPQEWPIQTPRCLKANGRSYRDKQSNAWPHTLKNKSRLWRSTSNIDFQFPLNNSLNFLRCWAAPRRCTVPHNSTAEITGELY